mgnify:CR=1 FL=1
MRKVINTLDQRTIAIMAAILLSQCPEYSEECMEICAERATRLLIKTRKHIDAEIKG